MHLAAITMRVDRYPDRDETRDALDQRWMGVLASLGFQPLLMPNILSEPADFASMAGAEAVILTGGNSVGLSDEGADVSRERDRTEAELFHWAVSKRVPVLGVCRGFQHLNLLLGGRVATLDGHVAKPHALRWEPGAPQGLAALDLVNSYHEVGIDRDGLVEDLLPLAWAPDGTVEAALHKNLPILGIMWHPERPPYPPEPALAALRDFLGGRS